MAQIEAFKILGLPERFALEDAAIEENWRKTIALVHPDRFADKTPAERRVAEQWAGRINEAKDALLDPVSRASLLIKAAGVDVGAETDTKMPAEFLLEQIEWREEHAAAAGNEKAEQALLARVEAVRSELLGKLAIAIDQTHDWTLARDAVRRLMFIEKMRREMIRGKVHPHE